MLRALRKWILYWLVGGFGHFGGIQKIIWQGVSCGSVDRERLRESTLIGCEIYGLWVEYLKIEVIVRRVVGFFMRICDITFHMVIRSIKALLV